MTLIALLRDSPQPRRPEERSRRRRVSKGRAGASGVLSQKDEGRPFRGAKRSVSHDRPQVVDIIGASESVISLKCLFSRAWAPFRFSTRAVGQLKAGPESRKTDILKNNKPHPPACQEIVGFSSCGSPAAKRSRRRGNAGG